MVAMRGRSPVTQPIPPLCAPCRAEREAWEDTTPNHLIPRLGFAHGSGAAYDASVPGIRDGRRARFEEWRSVVNHQRRLIADACRNGVHVTERKGDDDDPVA